MVELAARFATLCRRLGLALDVEQAYAELTRHYATPTRAYHDLTHVAHCLEELDRARHLAGDADAVELAVWYHDAVLDSRQKDNELKSAELARDVLREAGASDELTAQVFDLIMATCHGAVVPETDDARIMVDCDLAILGQPADRFDAYDAAIREEYAWVPRAAYVTGRSQVLEGFLARERIYLTELFHDLYEAQARTNLHRSIQSLIAHL